MTLSSSFSPSTVGSTGLAVVSTQPARRGRAGLVVAVIVVSMVAAGLLAVTAYSYGPNTFALASLLALLPFVVILWTLAWVDRWEPEPRAAIAFALLWGMGMSPVMALLAGALYQGDRFNTPETDLFSSVVMAAVTEEFSKGLGVLLIFLVIRRHFDGVIDGIVYAGAVAAGFALMENILYLSTSMVDSVPGEGHIAMFATFVLRGVIAPFTHLFFTACTGIALGLVSRGGSRWQGVVAFFIGLIPAMLLHAGWNFMASTMDALDGTIFATLVFTLPCFVLYAGLLVWLRRKEQGVIRMRLGELVAQGHITQSEVDMVSSLRQRRASRVWAAKSYGRHAKQLMKRFQHNTIRLAYVLQRLRSQRGNQVQIAKQQHDLMILLHQIHQGRQEFVQIINSHSAP